MAEQLYVLVTDPRMPSKDNLWGTQAASSANDARIRFHDRIKLWHSSGSKDFHLQRMEADRTRRLDEADFDVELS
jgi:hypothetical protein